MEGHMGKRKSCFSLVLAIVAFAGLVLTGCGGAGKGDLAVGAVISVTGKYVSGEAGILNGARMAINEVNASGGVNGKKLNLIVEDSGSEQAGAVNAFNRVSSKKPLFVIDSAVSSFVLAQMPDIAKVGIPTYAMGENPKVTAEGNPWILRFGTPDNVTPLAAVQFAMVELRKSSIAIVRVNNDFGKAWEDAILAYLAKKGIRPAAVQVFGADDKDMTAQLNKVKTSGADAMIVVADPPTHAIMLMQRKQLGLSNVVYIGSNTSVQPQTLDLLKSGEAEGIYALTSSVPPEDPDQNVRAWNAKYKGLYKIDADYLAANAYDAVMVTVDAIKAVGADKAKIRDWILANVKGRKGMGNTWNFSANGDGGTQISIVQVKGGVPSIVNAFAVQL
jgi:branched-chain amino acid transport system substrate-binding protein